MKTALVVAMVLALMVVGCGTTGRTGNSLRTGGMIANPDGSFEQVWSEHVRDQFGQELVVLKSKETKSVYDPRTKRYDVRTTTRIDGYSGGATVENKAVAGFISNIPNATGDIAGAYVLRGANWGTNVTTGGPKIDVKTSTQQTQGQNQKQQQKQKQGQQQSQAQAQAQTAKGGQGGQGGNGDKPGHGYGDKNHDHAGPPGHN